MSVTSSYSTAGPSRGESGDVEDMVRLLGVMDETCRPDRLSALPQHDIHHAPRGLSSESRLRSCGSFLCKDSGETATFRDGALWWCLGLPLPAPLAGALAPAPVGDTGLPVRAAAFPTEGETGRIVGECEVSGRGLGAAVDCDDGGGMVPASPAGTSILFPMLRRGHAAFLLSSCDLVVCAWEAW